MQHPNFGNLISNTSTQVANKTVLSPDLLTPQTTPNLDGQLFDNQPYLSMRDSFLALSNIGKFDLNTATATVRAFLGAHELEDMDPKLDLAHKLLGTIKARCAELEALNERPERKKININSIVKKIEKILLAEEPLGEKITLNNKLFKKNFYGDKLKERECDKIVEQVLEYYGHENIGPYLNARRNSSLSTWRSDYVPQAVKNLVKYRGCAQDTELSAKDVLPHLKKALRSLADQLRIENKKQEIKPVYLGDECLHTKACKIIEIWPNKDRPKLISRLSSLLKDPEYTSEAHVARMQVLKAYKTLGAAITTVIDELDKKRLEFEKQQSIQAICGDPLSVFKTQPYKKAPAIIFSAYKECSDDMRKICRENIEHAIKTSGWDSFRLKSHLKKLLTQLHK